MKYLMLDTNIYIDMVVSRNQSHKAESYSQLIKLLDYGEIKLLVPKIVITEVFRHLEHEIDKVGRFIEDIKKKTKEFYWINHSEELKKFNETFNPIKTNINLLQDDFERNSINYKNTYKEQLNKLFRHDNCIVLEENENIVFKAMQRSIYKKRPFHYGGKDNDKDSMADSIIIETLININTLISINEIDNIFFISRNPMDFSDEKDKNTLHNDILGDIKARGLVESIKYSTLFTKTLLEEFKDEIESAGLTEEILEEAKYLNMLEVQAAYEMQNNYERQSAGLSPLSTNYEEIISELDKIEDLIKLIHSIKKHVVFKSDDFNEAYNSLYDLIVNHSLESLQNTLEKNPFLKKMIDDCEDVKNVKAVLNELIDWQSGGEVYTSFVDDFEFDECFLLNKTILTFYDGMKNKYELKTVGYLNPSDDESDDISLYLLKGDETIGKGSISVYYGYINFTDDGNVGNGAQEDISIDIDDISNSLSDIAEEIINDLENRTNKIQEFIEILS